MSEIKKCKHGRNFCCECHMAEDLKSVREAMKLDNQRIYPAGTSRDLQGELNEAQSQLAALREELAKKHELLMSMADRANQFEGERDQWRAMVGHICATIPTADVLASTETGQKTVDYFKALQQRLADAERRNAELVGLLNEVTPELDDFITGSLLDRLKAALNPNPEAASHDE